MEDYAIISGNSRGEEPRHPKAAPPGVPHHRDTSASNCGTLKS